jgi:hypothetical protein
MTIVLFGSVLSVTFALVILGLLRRLSGHPARTASDAVRSGVRKLFRSYVRCLARDFTRIYSTLEIAIVESRQDRPDLVRLMLQQKARFVMAMFAIELRLAVHAWGMNRMDVERLVQSVSTLKGAWSLLSVPQEPAASNS